MQDLLEIVAIVALLNLLTWLGQWPRGGGAKVASAKQNERLLWILLRKVRQMAHTIDETLAAATAASNKVDGLIAFVGGLKKQLDDALSGVTLPPAVQAKIDQIFDLDTATATKADAAISTVPPAPAPEPTPATPPA